MFWLIKGNNGKNILLDAAFIPGSHYEKEFGLKDYVRPDSVLPKLGLKAGDITDIILSHPHWDHISGIGLFPNARIWIQKDDYNYFVGEYNSQFVLVKTGARKIVLASDNLWVYYSLEHLRPAAPGGTFDTTA
jgi:glyoxylase-like metal-dependent hydrolase (beta-lactamase superfamily II)